MDSQRTKRILRWPQKSRFWDGGKICRLSSVVAPLKVGLPHMSSADEPGVAEVRCDLGLGSGTALAAAGSSPLPLAHRWTHQLLSLYLATIVLPRSHLSHSGGRIPFTLSPISLTATNGCKR